MEVEMKLYTEGGGGPGIQVLSNGKLKNASKGIKLDIRMSEMEDMHFNDNRIYQSFRIVAAWSYRHINPSKKYYTHFDNEPERGRGWKMVRVFDEIFDNLQDNVTRTIDLSAPLPIVNYNLPGSLVVMMIDRNYLGSRRRDYPSYEAWKVYRNIPKYKPFITYSYDDGYCIMKVTQQG
ncbi:hypothetical protein [Maribacter sp. Hel_I_7]|uniref:hypothetical protein n=1 Tax=Maribacter sp. Hel_I_7 TaxID=1249997 RepID=UPI00047D4E52|nr:hypothetical protein [Maribacter sp. Hel_I_7]